MSPAEDGQVPEPGVWDFWQDGDRSACLNMAIDDVLLQTAAERARPLLRIYGWDRPSVSIGYVQTIQAAPPGFAVVRRPTGGGVVNHLHDVTYTVVVPATHWICGLDRVASYGWINRAVSDGLARCRLNPSLAQQEIASSVDRSRMVCFQHPTRYDVLDGDRKVAGSAQRRTRDGILHQGSINLGEKRTVDRDRMIASLLDGFRSVLNLQFADFAAKADFLAAANDLARERYATDAWLNRR